MELGLGKVPVKRLWAADGTVWVLWRLRPALPCPCRCHFLRPSCAHRQCGRPGLGGCYGQLLCGRGGLHGITFLGSAVRQALVSLSSRLSSSLLPAPHSAPHQLLLQHASQPLRSGTLQSCGPTPASPTTHITAFKVWDSVKPWPWGTCVLILCGSLTRAPHTTKDGDQSPFFPPGTRLPSLMVFFLSCPQAAMLWPKVNSNSFVFGIFLSILQFPWGNWWTFLGITKPGLETTG